MNVLVSGLVKFLTWIGTMFLIRKGASDETKLDQAEKTIEVVKDLNRPRPQSELDELWERNKAKYQ